MEWFFLALGFALGVCAAAIVVSAAADLGEKRNAIR
jgi:hypothetical protein